MGLREYNFINGPETDTLPAASTPTASSDLVTKGYADSNYVAVISAETQQSLSNNAAAADITGLVFNKTNYRAVEVKYTIERRTSTQGYRQIGRLFCAYEAFSDTWSIENIVDTGASGEVTGVTFSITSSGQIQAATDNTTGSSHICKIRHQVVQRFATET